MTGLSYIIVNKTDQNLCWSNEEGWVTDTFDSFTEEERINLNLPIDGEWRQVPWKIGEDIPDDEPCCWCNDEGSTDGTGEVHPCAFCGAY